MLKGFKVRLFPTKSQEAKLWQAIGTARWVWNWGVAYNQNLYAKEKRFAFEYELKKEFTKVRNSGEFPWLKEVAAKVPAVTLLTLGKSYSQCFTKRKKGINAGLPKFKSRQLSKPAFGLDAETVLFYPDGVQILKVGHVKFESNFTLLELQGKIWNPRISFQAGKWLLTFSKEIEVPKPKLNNFSVGIDLGIKILAVVSCDGNFYKAKNINKSHKIVRQVKQLKHKQRALSRKKKDSKNRQKALNAVRKCYQKITNIRHDYTHKTTTKIVNLLPLKIVIEDLQVQNMMKNRHLAKAIQEQNFSKLRILLEYKAKERGIEVIVADKFFPSSKTCSSCGSIKQDLMLKDRVYKCPSCGLEIDRDENAALNLLNKAV